jgi:hypothetical protein
MPGAQLTAGLCRLTPATTLPGELPELRSDVTETGDVALQWPLPLPTNGLEFELHRSDQPNFEPDEKTRIGWTSSFRFADNVPPTGQQHYALVVVAGSRRSRPVRTEIEVPELPPPTTPTGLQARAHPGEIALEWEPATQVGLRYRVLRAKADSESFELVSDSTTETHFTDGGLAPGEKYAYAVRAVDRRQRLSDVSRPVTAAALPLIKEPVFQAPFETSMVADLINDRQSKGVRRGKARITESVLDLRDGGHVTYAHAPEFDLRHGFSVECWLRIDEPSQMPVVVSCGRWQGPGWFVQVLGGRWRWYLGGVNCDGGRAPIGRWVHVLATYDGSQARVFQDGVQVASTPCKADRTTWSAPLFVGQYGPSPGTSYQVLGRIARLRIYHRAVSAEEAAVAFKDGPP